MRVEGGQANQVKEEQVDLFSSMPTQPELFAESKFTLDTETEIETEPKVAIIEETVVKTTPSETVVEINDHLSSLSISISYSLLERAISVNSYCSR